MAGSIKLFQFYQECHQIIGIHPSQSNQRQSTSNWKNTVTLIAFGLMMPTTAAFIIFDAESMFQYGSAFFLLICIIAFGIFYLIFIQSREITYKFIVTCEKFIEKSKISSSVHIFHQKKKTYPDFFSL